MENKSLFTSIVLAITLVVGFFFYDKQVSELKKEIGEITQEYNNKLSAIHSSQKKSHTSDEISALEDLNNQLIQARSELKKAQDKLSLANSKTSVLADEISQMSDARNEVNNLKGSLQSTQEKLQISGDKLNYLENIFETQNKATVSKNITRIAQLKETSTGIAVTGLVVPAIGVATLVSYTTEEIQNYCSNIESIMKLENKVFGKVVSIDVQMQKNYHNQCEVSLKDKIKKGLKKLKIKQPNN